MSLRVVQWATGSVGVAAIKGVLEHPELELAGCWVHSDAKNGKDVGEIIGTPALGAIATNSLDEILALDADAVIYAPLLPNADEVAALLRSGKNVVSPVGWFYPGAREAAPLEVAAQAGNATLHGAGIGPGAATELFPLLLSVMSTGVTFVRSEEFSDLRTYGAPDVLRYVMGFHGTPDAFVTVKGWQPESVEAGLKSNPGVVATAAHCVNAVPATCAAPSGIQTFFDLPLITGRAAPALSR